MVKSLYVAMFVVFLRLQKSHLYSVPCASCPCVMCSEFHVKRESPSHRSSIIWRDLTWRFENSFLNRILLWVTSCCTDVSLSPLLSFPFRYCLCSFIQWKSLYRCAGSCGLHNCTGVGVVDCVLNVMAHAQKPDFVFRRNGRVHLNRPGGRQFSRLLAAEVCASAVVMLDTPCSEVVWRVLATHSIRQFPLHFPSRASPCAITLETDSTYICLFTVWFLSWLWYHTK